MQTLLKEITAPPLPPSAIIASLVKSLNASFGPRAIAVGVIQPASGQLEIAHLSGVATHAALESLLAWAESPEAGRKSPLTVGTPIKVGSFIVGAVALEGIDRQFDPVLFDTLVGLAGFALDTGNQLRRLEGARLSWVAMADAVPVALCLIDAQGRVERANRAFAELLGVELIAVIGRQWP
ncbi:MAG: PAS domain-containing protein, partial [Gemmatimonadota bacterium]